jgi:tetratricopeptide (TPR) repeat protein
VSLRRWLPVLYAGLLAWLSGSCPVRADDTIDQEARALFEAGKLAFEEGRFENALGHFQRAFELSGRPRLLYNIGTAADRLRKDDVALAAFERYLAETPDAPNRSAVEARIQVLRTQLAAADPPDAQPAPEPEPVKARENPAEEPASRVAPWLTLSAGALVAIAGGALVYHGTTERAAVEDAPRGTRFREVADSAERAPKLLIGGGVALGVGLAALAAGGLWLRLGRPGERLSVAVSPHGIAARGSF